MINKTKRSSLTKSIFITSPILLLGFVIFTGTGCKISKDTSVNVPNLYGAPLMSAQNELQNRGLYLEVVGEKYSDDIPAGLICWQSPLSGSVVARGSTIKVMLSKGKEPVKESKDTLSVTIPELKGLTLKEAIDKLYTLNLKLGKIEEKYSNEIEKGKIIKSDPGAGSVVTKGTQINLVKSLGKKPVKKVRVPKVTHMKIWKARKILSSKGLKVKEIRKVTTEYYENTVMSQSPAAGKLVPVGSTVTLIVADVLD